MLRQIVNYLPQIIIGLFALAGVLLLLSLYLIRRGRTGPYWRARREAGQQGGRLFLLSVGLFAAAFATAFFGIGALVAVRGFDALFPDRDALQGVVLPTLTPTSLDTMTDTPTVESTVIHMPTLTPTHRLPSATRPLGITPTPTRTPAPTSTAMPTRTPTITPTPTPELILGLTPLQSDVESPANAVVEIIAADEVVSENWTPVEPRRVFAAGIKRIYLFISYRDMRDMVVWSRVLYRDGLPIQGRSYFWTLGEEGSSFFFFGDENGYPPGDYEARLFLDDKEVSRFEFSITPP